MERRQLWRTWIGLLACGVSGCSIVPTTGELGNGGFGYRCIGGGTDVACTDGLAMSAPVPSAVAVGALVTFDFAPTPSKSSKEDDTADLTFTLKSAAPEILVAEGRGFRFVNPGTVALLARSPSGVVLDFIHLDGAVIDHLDIEDALGNATSEVHLKPRGSVVLNVTPKSASGATLAGPLHYAWSISDEAVASLTLTQPFGENQRANQVTVVAGQQDGAATISLTVQDQKLDIPVQIGGSP